MWRFCSEVIAHFVKWLGGDYKMGSNVGIDASICGDSLKPICICSSSI